MATRIYQGNRVTINGINEAVEKLGYNERLYRADQRDGGYYYWGDGDAACFEESGVYGSMLRDMTVDQWIQDLRERRDKYERANFDYIVKTCGLCHEVKEHYPGHEVCVDCENKAAGPPPWLKGLRSEDEIREEIDAMITKQNRLGPLDCGRGIYGTRIDVLRWVVRDNKEKPSEH